MLQTVLRKYYLKRRMSFPISCKRCSSRCWEPWLHRANRSVCSHANDRIHGTSIEISQLAKQATDILERMIRESSSHQYLQMYISLAEYGPLKLQRSALALLPRIVEKAIQQNRLSLLQRYVCNYVFVALRCLHTTYSSVVLPSLRRITKNCSHSDSRAIAVAMIGTITRSPDVRSDSGNAP